MKKFILILLNFLAMYLMSNGNAQDITVGFVIILFCYLYLIINFILDSNSKNYQLANPTLISEPSLPQPKFKVEFNDGDSDFEKKIAELNIRSNNAGVVKIYSLGIDRKKTENGIEDTLNLVIPPSKSIKENEEALELYKKKYHSEEAA